ISRSASSASNQRCSTSAPPLVSAAPKAWQKLPEKKNPFDDHTRGGSSKQYHDGQRQSCRQGPRCALRMPLALPVDPEEKNRAPGSLGATDAAAASTMSGETAVPLARNSVHPSTAPPPSSSTAARCRRNG